VTAYRGSDETLDREIAAVEQLVRVRLRRASDDLRDLETTLRELRRERRRRQAATTGAMATPESEPTTA
jgi:hypothetical protein